MIDVEKLANDLQDLIENNKRTKARAENALEFLVEAKNLAETDIKSYKEEIVDNIDTALVELETLLDRERIT